MTAEIENVDAIVIGANIRGLVATYALSALGFRAVLIEPGPRIGGADGTFVTEHGDAFEFGMHVLDSMRSIAATRLFTHAVDQRVHRVTLHRAIVLRNHVIPYAPKPSELPPAIRSLLRGDDLSDDIGDALPARERLAHCYGPAFADMIFDEVLPSFPCEHRHLAFGVDEARLLANVYPWFFPRARRARSNDESRAFHDRLRDGIEQQILYPREGGFGGFAAGLLSKLDPQRIEVLTDTGPPDIELAPGSHTVETVGVAGRRFRAPHCFWASSWPQLCTLLDLPCQDVSTDRIVLGSFRLDRPVATPYQEILVADPTHPINRIYFPARFRESDDPLMQIEFAFPRADDRSLEPAEWRDAWVESTRRLGLLDADHRVVAFDFKTLCLHFNGFGMEGEPLRDADPSRLQADTNIRPVVPSMANLNLNGHVPRTLEYIARTMTGDLDRGRLE